MIYQLLLQRSDQMTDYLVGDIGAFGLPVRCSVHIARSIWFDYGGAGLIFGSGNCSLGLLRALNALTRQV